MRKMPSAVAASHAGHDDGAERSTCARTCTGCSPEREAAEDERERRHRDRTQAQPRAFERGVDHGSSVVELELRELDDQDGVLRREADEHDQTDLRVDVVVEVARQQAEERAEDGDGHAEKDAEGQRPAS